MTDLSSYGCTTPLTIVGRMLSPCGILYALIGKSDHSLPFQTKASCQKTTGTFIGMTTSSLDLGLRLPLCSWHSNCFESVESAFGEVALNSCNRRSLFKETIHPHKFDCLYCLWGKEPFLSLDIFVAVIKKTICSNKSTLLTQLLEYLNKWIF